MKYLRSDEYLDNAPKNVGTVHINHAGCPAGEDRKKRLYITRKQDGTVVAYCHHCCLSGSTKRGVARSSSSVGRTLRALEDEQDTETFGGTPTTFKRKETVAFPRETSFDTTVWPKEVRDWYNNFGVTDTEAYVYGFGFVLDGWLSGRLGLPCYDSGILNGIQFRGILNAGGPKYLSKFRTEKSVTTTAAVTVGEANQRRYFDSEHAPHVRVPTASDGSGACVPRNTVCLVEDVLSAIRVGRQCRAIACLTSSMPEDILVRLAQQGYDTCIVWLDNDNVSVNRSARNIQRRLGMIFKNVRLVHDKADPKHYTDTDIAEELGL